MHIVYSIPVIEYDPVARDIATVVHVMFPTLCTIYMKTQNIKNTFQLNCIMIKKTHKRVLKLRSQTRKIKKKYDKEDKALLNNFKIHHQYVTAMGWKDDRRTYDIQFYKIALKRTTTRK